MKGAKVLAISCEALLLTQVWEEYLDCIHLDRDTQLFFVLAEGL